MQSCGPCVCCQRKKEPVLKSCYKQPKVVEAFTPCGAYVKPSAPLEAHTTYKLSYVPIGSGDTRSTPIRPNQSIVRSCEPMEDSTVQKISYQLNPVCVTRPALPRNHQLFAHAPMSGVSTQKHDFVPKPIDLRHSFRPDMEYRCDETPFENRTINKLSYCAPGRVTMAASCAPVRCYDPPSTPMDADTTHKMSYQPNKVGPRMVPPWANLGPYQRPSQPIDSGTVYKTSFLDTNTDCRRLPITPPACDNPVTSSKKFETGTVYKNSYMPARVSIAPPIIPVSGICVASAPIDGDTIQKLSYLPNPVCVTRPALPRNHQLFAHAPMSGVSTQKRDFVPKPIDLRHSFRPDPEKRCDETPFESRTINRLSYPDPGRVPPTAPCRPPNAYQKPDTPIEALTTQKMSYQPVKPRQLVAPPWASKSLYVTPTCRMEGNTVYRSSFLPPGEDCSEVTENGESTACSHTMDSTASPTNQTDFCVCRYPKAECCA